MVEQKRSTGDIRTDLAIEATETFQKQQGTALEGIDSTQSSQNGIKTTRVKVLTREAGDRIGKPPGTYLTFEAEGLRQRDRKLQRHLAGQLATAVPPMLNLDDYEDPSILIVGLGNQHATPDALGPRVVDHLLVTRHIRSHVPKDLQSHLHEVSAIAPGVLGTTGIETSEVIHGIIDRLRPDVLIVIDALASFQVERILTTVQLADTGIQPGSGVGNSRTSITPDSLNMPVVAIGVPTVVHALTIAGETLHRLQAKDGQTGWTRKQSRDLAKNLLPEPVREMMVTPKEIDMFIDEMSQIIASALDTALHPGLDARSLTRMDTTPLDLFS